MSLFEATGKAFELLLRPRLTDAIAASGDLSDRQHGVRRGRSTVGAVREVVEAFSKTKKASHPARPLLVLVTLDVRNAFNSASWVDILRALQSVFWVPPYLLRVARDYLRNRGLIYETDRGPVTREVTAEVAQESILGSDLWNGMYDGFLRLEMPRNAFLVAYTDDVAPVIVEYNADLAQLTLNRAMRRIGGWMSSHGLDLAVEKTEILVMTGKRIPTIIPIVVVTVRVVNRSQVPGGDWVRR